MMIMNRHTTATTTMNSTDPRPNLDHLINIKATVNTREYLRSFLSLLKSTPGISWDSRGNLLEPLRNFNIIIILKTLSDAGDKKGFEKEDIPIIRMILYSANIDPSFIRSNKTKKELMGWSKVTPLLAHAQKLAWEKYRL